MNVKDKIIEKMKSPTLGAIATITEKGLPWVRYVMVWSDEDLFIWFATFRRSRKAQQIEKKSEVHLTLGVTDAETAESYLQIQGKAVILTDSATKQASWYDHLENIFSGPEDPEYCVCRITPYRIEYTSMAPGKSPEVWKP
jgi:general stress protein 26